jgi:myo-inositol-1-phosphate synthase
MSPPSIDINPSDGYSEHPVEAAGPSGTTIVSVSSPNITYNHDHILSKYTYENAIVSKEAGKLLVKPTKTEYEFKTDTTVPRVGYLLSFSLI